MSEQHLNKQIIAGGDDEEAGVPLDAISLNTLGAHLLFGEINTASVYPAINFIIKSN